jgi:chondroitin sulfate synthase
MSTALFFQAKELFRQVYEKPMEAYHGSLDAIEYIKGISFHPVKDPAYMRRMHVFFSTQHIHRLLIRRRSLDRTIENLEPFLKGSMHWTSSRKLLSDHNDRSHRNARNSSQPWESFDFSKVWALTDKPPLRYIHDGTEAAMTKVVDFSKEILLRDGEPNLYEKISFDKWHNGYMRVDPKTGTEFWVDLGAKYQTNDPKQGVKVTRMRRTVRIRQTFGKFITKPEENYGVSKIPLHFIVPLMERLENFKRFLKSFEEDFILNNDPVKLLVVYFPDVASSVEQKKVFDQYVKKYPSVEMKWLDVKGPFKRAVGLQIGTDYFGNNSLLYFCDVDLVFRREFADRCRANAVLGKRAYFPVMFSQFNPKITFANKRHPGHYYYTKEAGFWRWYSFGPVCAYAKDINDSGGLNTDLLGWGLEDVDLYEKFLKRSDIEIFRAPDPGLVHVYHPHAPCDPKSTEEQQAMCRAAQADIYSSAPSCVDYLHTKGYLGYFL